MKHAIIAFLAAIASISYAELPDTLKDPATKEVVEYLDSKTSQAVNLSSDFRNVNSTITVSGMLDIGFVLDEVSCSNTTSCTNTCDAGLNPIGMGCHSNTTTVAITGNYLDNKTATCTTASQVSTLYVQAYCARVK